MLRSLVGSEMCIRDRFIDEAKNYWDDGYDEVVKDIKDYTDCDFKRERREAWKNLL